MSRRGAQGSAGVRALRTRLLLLLRTSSSRSLGNSWLRLLWELRLPRLLSQVLRWAVMRMLQGGLARVRRMALRLLLLLLLLLSSCCLHIHLRQSLTMLGWYALRRRSRTELFLLLWSQTSGVRGQHLLSLSYGHLARRINLLHLALTRMRSCRQFRTVP